MEDERSRYRSKGIFTITQLSYTFRPRRSPKRAKNPGRLRYPALQALAIRENTVYINGNPCRHPAMNRLYFLEIAAETIATKSGTVAFRMFRS